MSNKHMAGKSFPSRLADLCEFYLEEDQKLFTKEMENA
jgi:hypothetical protein